jgi:hypothetical protein
MTIMAKEASVMSSILLDYPNENDLKSGEPGGAS